MTKFPKQILITSTPNLISRVPNLLKSILAFNRDPVDFHILINFDIDSEEYAEAKLMFYEFQYYSKCKIFFTYISPELRKEYEGEKALTDEFNSGQSLRLYAGLLNLKGRFLYLDIDIICTANFDELFDSEYINLDEKPLAAVPDAFVNVKNNLSSGKMFEKLLPASMGLDNFNDLYFNSGVLLVNADKLSADNLWLKDITKLWDFPFMADQGYLNYLYEGKYQVLPCTYNYLVHHLMNNRWYYHALKWDQLETKSESEMSNQASEPTPASRPTDNAELTVQSQPTSSQNQLRLQTSTYRGYPSVRPVFLHFADKEKQWDISAREWFDLYSLFSRSLVDVLADEVSFYNQYLEELYHKYHYANLLRDYQSEEILHLTLKQLQGIHKQKPGTYNPIYTNRSFFNSQGIKNLYLNSQRKKRRKEYNEELYRKLNS